MGGDIPKTNQTHVTYLSTTCEKKTKPRETFHKPSVPFDVNLDGALLSGIWKGIFESLKDRFIGSVGFLRLTALRRLSVEIKEFSINIHNHGFSLNPTLNAWESIFRAPIR